MNIFTEIPNLYALRLELSYFPFRYPVWVKLNCTNTNNFLCQLLISKKVLNEKLKPNCSFSPHPLPLIPSAKAMFSPQPLRNVTRPLH